jgi:hypothetical protein
MSPVASAATSSLRSPNQMTAIDSDHRADVTRRFTRLPCVHCPILLTKHRFRVRRLPPSGAVAFLPDSTDSGEPPIGAHILREQITILRRSAIRARFVRPRFIGERSDGASDTANGAKCCCLYIISITPQVRIADFRIRMGRPIHIRLGAAASGAGGRPCKRKRTARLERSKSGRKRP